MATLDAGERGLVRTVSLVNTAAGRARLARVRRIDHRDRHASSRRFVGEKGAQLCEGPAVQSRSMLCALGLGSGADMRQCLQRNATPGAFCAGNDSFRDNVVLMLSEPGLCTGQELKSAPLVAAPISGFGFGRLALAVSTHLGEPVSRPHGCFPRENVALAGCRDIGNTHVDANPVRRREADRFWNVASADQKPLPLGEGKVRLTLTKRKHPLLVFASNKGNSDASMNRPNGNGVPSQPEDAIVVWLRCVLADGRSGCTVNLECISHFRNATDHRLGGQAKASACFRIRDLLEIETPKCCGLKSKRCQPIAGFIAALKRSLQRLILLTVRLEFDFCN